VEGRRLFWITHSFFKVKSNAKVSNSIEKSRLWLNLTNTQGAFKQTLIGYITGATNEYDNVYDGVSFNGNAFIDFIVQVRMKILSSREEPCRLIMMKCHWVIKRLL
jgi:hypothetical protein